MRVLFRGGLRDPLTDVFDPDVAGVVWVPSSAGGEGVSEGSELSSIEFSMSIESSISGILMVDSILKAMFVRCPSHE